MNIRCGLFIVIVGFCSSLITSEQIHSQDNNQDDVSQATKKRQDKKKLTKKRNSQRDIKNLDQIEENKACLYALSQKVKEKEKQRQLLHYQRNLKTELLLGDRR